MAKSYFTDEQVAYIAKMAKARGIDEREAAQNLMDKGISRDKALSKYSGAAKPKTKVKAARPTANARTRKRGAVAKVRANAKGTSKPGRKARATISQPRQAPPAPAPAPMNGVSTHIEAGSYEAESLNAEG